MGWEEYAKPYFRYCTPATAHQAHLNGVLFDNYTKETTKQLMQRRRGHPGKRVYITSQEQSMPQQNYWDIFLHNAENKTELIHFLVSYDKDHKDMCKISL